jgi:hypothetical protein
MTAERLRAILAQADQTCLALKMLRDMLRESAVAPQGQAAVDTAMVSVVQLDRELGSYAVDLIRRNAA